MIGRKQGYSKPVDMWSIGIIATALLTGDVIFTNRTDPNYEVNPKKIILNMASKCDLSALEDPHGMWRLVGKRPKDFVRKLLVLEEPQRLTVQQALAHEWFTNKHHVDEFEAVYQRAIHDWEPRRKIFRLVEALDLCRLPKQAIHATNIKVTNYSKMSHHFAIPPSSDRKLKSKIYCSTFSNRVHTPLPKIDEENVAALQTSSQPYSDTHKPIVQHILAVETSMSQLALAALSEGATNNHLEYQSAASDSNPSGTSTEIIWADLQNSQHASGSQSPQSPTLQCSDFPAGPPHSSSSGSSDCESVTETPPYDTSAIDRKRRFSPTPRDLSQINDYDTNIDGTPSGEPTYIYHAKRLRTD